MTNRYRGLASSTSEHTTMCSKWNIFDTKIKELDDIIETHFLCWYHESAHFQLLKKPVNFTEW